MSASLPKLRRPERAFQLRDLPLDGEGALYDQIYRALRGAILEGRVSPGTRLPTTRALARELGISRNTVVSAFEPLRAEGYVVSRVGAGTFVAPQVGSAAVRRPLPVENRRRAQPVARPLRLSRYGRALEAQAPRRPYDRDQEARELSIDFRPCVPDLERLPYDDWRRSLVRTAHHLESASFDYADPSGDPGLRLEIARYLARARGVVCRPEEIVVVGGVAQALDLATRLFVEVGDAVLIEDPHYLGARRNFEAAGARLVGAPVDADGLDLGRVASVDLEACRMAYVTPSHQFPTGAILSLARRLELLRWAERSNSFVLEDDYDSEFRYAGRAIPSLKSLDEGGRVLYVGTFSKTLIPALRIAYLVLPPELVDLFRSAKWLSDGSAPVLEQAALARFLGSGDFERHLRRARTLYSASRVALVEGIAAELGEWQPAYQDSQAGLHLLLRLPKVPAAHGASIVRAARALGVGLYPATPCYLDRPDANALQPLPCEDGAAEGGAGVELVMGFGRLESDAIRSGLRALRGILCEYAPLGD